MKRSRALRVAYLGLAAGALAACGEEAPSGVFSMTECLAKFDTTVCTEAYQAARKEMATNAPRFSSKEECEAFAGQGNCENAPAATASAPASSPAASAPAATAQAPAAGQAPAPQTVVVHESGGSFMPAMMGFMVGQMLANNAGAAQSRGYYYGPPPNCSRYDAKDPNCAPRSSSSSSSGGGGGGGGSWGRGYAYAATPESRTAATSDVARAKSYVSSGSTLQQARSPVVARSSPGFSGASSTTTAGRSSAVAPSSTTSRGGFGSSGRASGGFSGS